MPITIYKVDASPPARTALIVAEILGLEIETKEVNLIKKEQFSSEFLEKNPTHTIPVLEDGDFVLTDSHAIIIYLISKYGTEKTAALYPVDVEKRAIVNQRLFFDASILFPRFLSLARDVLYNGAMSIDEEKAASVEEAYGFLEKYLERSTYVAGDSLTIADIACVTTLSTMIAMVPIDEQYSKVQAWLDALSQEEWYQKINVKGLTDFGILIATMLQTNAEQ